MKTIEIELEDHAAEQLSFLREVAEVVRQKTGYCRLNYDISEQEGHMSILLNSAYVYPYKKENVGVFIQGNSIGTLFLSPLSFDTTRAKRMTMDDAEKVAAMICRTAEREIAYRDKVLAFEEECEDV